MAKTGNALQANRRPPLYDYAKILSTSENVRKTALVWGQFAQC